MPTPSWTTKPTHSVIATGIDDLATQNPVKPGTYSPHHTYDGVGFRIRQLAFDAGAVLPEHTAPDPILINVVEGEVAFEIGTETYQLTAGAVLHVAAEVPHQVTATTQARLVITLID